MIDYTRKLVGEKYLVERLLGKGGMGAVYQAEHQALKKQVAIKFLHGKFADNDQMVQRFYREAQAAAAINHANIVSVIDVGLSGQREPYLVMEFLEGESLAHLIKHEAPLDVPTVCGLAEPVLLGLQAAHEIGIIHRDLKPDNIFLVHQPEGAPVIKLIDFGISKILETPDSPRMTQTGMVLGTPSYMAPEQAMGRVDSIDARTDLYSVGVILFQMLTGELPITADNNQEMMIKVATAHPRHLATLRKDLAPRMSALVMRAIAKNRGDRFKSAEAMLEALGAVQGFEERNTRITQLGLSMTDVDFVQGDLGSLATTADTLPGGKGAAPGSETSETPGVWTRTWRSYRRATGKTRLTVALLIAVGLLSTALAGLVRHSGSSSEPTAVPIAQTPVVAAKAPPSDDSEVTITIEGAPADAQITFGGDLQQPGPFTTPRSSTPKTLRIVAAGFLPFSTPVVPRADQRIVVALEELPAEDGPGTGANPMVTPPAKTKRRQPTRSDKPVRSGGRNTLYSDNYD